MNHSLILAVVTLACLPGAAARAQTATDLNCTGCVGEADIAPQAVTSGKILNGTIATADIKASAVTTDKTKNGTIARADQSSRPHRGPNSQSHTPASRVATSASAQPGTSSVTQRLSMTKHPIQQ